MLRGTGLAFHIQADYGMKITLLKRGCLCGGVRKKQSFRQSAHPVEFICHCTVAYIHRVTPHPILQCLAREHYNNNWKELMSLENNPPPPPKKKALIQTNLTWVFKLIHSSHQTSLTRRFTHPTILTWSGHSIMECSINWLCIVPKLAF